MDLDDFNNWWNSHRHMKRIAQGCNMHACRDDINQMLARLTSDESSAPIGIVIVYCNVQSCIHIIIVNVTNMTWLLAVMLILALVLKESLRTDFKFSSLSLRVWSLIVLVLVLVSLILVLVLVLHSQSLLLQLIVFYLIIHCTICSTIY